MITNKLPTTITIISIVTIIDANNMYVIGYPDGFGPGPINVVVFGDVSLVDVKCRPDDVFCTVNRKSSVVIFSENKSMVVILVGDVALLPLVPGRALLFCNI